MSYLLLFMIVMNVSDNLEQHVPKLHTQSAVLPVIIAMPYIIIIYLCVVIYYLFPL